MSFKVSKINGEEFSEVTISCTCWDTEWIGGMPFLLHLLWYLPVHPSADDRIRQRPLANLHFFCLIYLLEGKCRVPLEINDRSNINMPAPATQQERAQETQKRMKASTLL